MKFNTLFFDLDATLYPANNGLWAEIGNRITKFLEDRLGLSKLQAQTLKKSYYEKYGTTLRGLQFHKQVDTLDYLSYVHDISLEKYLRPDPPLQEMINSLPQTKWIFTNSDHNHATRVLHALGLETSFDGIVSLETMDYECKPHLHAYQTALKTAGVSNSKQVAYLDDSMRNLQPANALGFFTILIDIEGETIHSIDNA
ncbi:MAG: pyrimidine 5'-nucleotidase, partial [Anaerolineae bacterium]|nr:pyrimidine 5'-nucleotidase [Anaerolineae bacterium]